MYNSLAISIYMPFLLIASAVSVLELVRYFQNRRNKHSIMFSFMCLSVTGWLLFNVLALLIYNQTIGVYIWIALLAFVGLSVPTKFLFVHWFFRPNKRFSVGVSFLFFIIPLITAVISVLPSLQPFIRSVEIIDIYPSRIYESSRGSWFWVHTGYSYLMTVATSWIIITGHIRKPKFYRLSSTLTVVGLAATMVGNVIVLMGFVVPNLDPTPMAASITLVFFYLAITNDDYSIFARHARGQVLNHIEDLVLIMGKDGDVSDFNTSAKRWF